MSQGHTPLSAPPTSPPQGGRSTAAVGFTSRRLLTLALSPLAGRGDEASALAADVLLPACGEKVAGRPDEGQRAMDQGGIATARQQLRGTAPHPTRSVGRGHPPLSATPTSPPQGGRSAKPYLSARIPDMAEQRTLGSADARSDPRVKHHSVWISPLEGEMPGRAEGGEKLRDTQDVVRPLLPSGEKCRVKRGDEGAGCAGMRASLPLIRRYAPPSPRWGEETSGRRSLPHA